MVGLERAAEAATALETAGLVRATVAVLVRVAEVKAVAVMVVAGAIVWAPHRHHRPQ